MYVELFKWIIQYREFSGTSSRANQINYILLQRMKLFLFLWFTLALLCIKKVSSKHLNEHDIVGVNSNQKIEDLLKKAVSGFRNAVHNGTELFGIPISDSYKIENLFWTYEDEDSGTKLDLTITAPATLKGLSSFITDYLEMNIKELDFQYYFHFENLQLEIPYKIEGFIKNIFPVYGQGVANMKMNHAYSYTSMNLSLKKSRIVLNRLYGNSGVSSIESDIPDFMNLPSSFSDRILNDIIHSVLRYEYTSKLTAEFVENQFQKYVAGKTIDEVIECLKFYANKAE